MNSRDIGLSTILAGTWRMAQWEMSAQQRLTWMHQCLEQGVHSFDLADLYGDYLVDGLVGKIIQRTVPVLQGGIPLFPLTHKKLTRRTC